MITKIQSFTDVITNSSSTVFVMCEANATYYNELENTNNCISIEPITLDWLLNNPQEVEMVCEMINVDISLISSYHKSHYSSWGHWDTPCKEDWETFIEIHKEKLLETFKDMYWVDIEDHFEDADIVTDNARDDAEWSDYRH